MYKISFSRFYSVALTIQNLTIKLAKFDIMWLWDWLVNFWVYYSRLPNMQSFHVRQLINNYIINKHQEKTIQPQGPLLPLPERGWKNTLIIDKINISSGPNVFGIKTETGHGKKQDISSVSKLHLSTTWQHYSNVCYKSKLSTTRMYRKASNPANVPRSTMLHTS